jgi:pimeloyl-ACP methyl ester carboxylesterase
VIDQGRGVPVVLVPGVQGRWEWMRPAVDALSRRCRVVSFSLNEAPADASDAFGAWVGAVDAALDRIGTDKAVVLGHSFGGLVAVRYAALRPERTAGLVLVSTPSPRHSLGWWDRLHVRHPVLTFPLFVARAGPRLPAELIAARSTWPARVRLAAAHLWRAVRWPASPARMADWVRQWAATDIATDCARVRAPTLVVKGEPALDRVAPVASTLDYLALIPGSRHVMLRDTGHLGPVSRPDALAEVVAEFIQADLSPAVANLAQDGSPGDNRGMKVSPEDARASHD